MKETGETAQEGRILLRYEEAARTLGLCRATVCQMVERGEFPVVRIGRAVRIPTSALDEWVTRNAVATNKAQEA